MFGFFVSRPYLLILFRQLSSIVGIDTELLQSPLVQRNALNGYILRGSAPEKQQLFSLTSLVCTQRLCLPVAELISYVPLLPFQSSFMFLLVVPQPSVF